MFFKKKKIKLPDVVLTEDEKSELLKEAIKELKKEMMVNKVREYMYLLETLKPTNMGKAQAEEGMATHQKRGKYLEENIQVVILYADEHDIKI